MRKRRQQDKIRLGVDFGTTRTHVARVESGNYPLITFETEEGEAKEWIPSIVAGRGRERLFGWKALSKQSDPAWQKVRSLKSYLSQATPSASMELGDESFPHAPVHSCSDPSPQTGNLRPCAFHR